MQGTLNLWLGMREAKDLEKSLFCRSLEVSADVSISANSQPMRAVESYHLLAYYTVMGDECSVDITNFLTDNFSVNKSSE